MRASKHGTPAQRREKVLRAGATCFARKGFYDATFDDIIGESGLSKGSLYWHFTSKDELYDAVVAHSVAQIELWIAAGPDALAGSGPAVDRLFSTLVVDLALHEDEYRLLYLAPRPARAEEPIRHLTQRFLDYLEDVVRVGVAQGDLDAQMGEVLPDVVYALIEGMILRRLSDQSFDAARFARHAAHLVRNAAAAPAGLPSPDVPSTKERNQ